MKKDALTRDDFLKAVALVLAQGKVELAKRLLPKLPAIWEELDSPPKPVRVMRRRKSSKRSGGSDRRVTQIE
jgi:hypothetical protein